MVFKAKIDRFYITFISVTLLILAVIIFLLLFLEESNNLPYIIILLSTFIVSMLLILWSTFSITYTFEADYLFVKGGPMKSKIPYDEMTKVSFTKDILTGYRLMSAREGIEICYKTALLGSVKISPAEEEMFIEELVKRSPQIEVKR